MYLFICLFIYSLIYLFTYLFIHLFTYLFTYLSIHLYFDEILLSKVISYFPHSQLKKNLHLNVVRLEILVKTCLIMLTMLKLHNKVYGQLQQRELLRTSKCIDLLR